MNRRDFCRSTLELGLFSVASSMLPWRSLAASSTSTAKPQFFIMIRIFGGWDTSLSSEPWTAALRPDEKDFFIEYRADELLPFGNSFVGPALKPLQSYFDRMTLFNGIFMTASDGGHDSAALYASTGNGQGGLGVLPLELEGRLYSSPFGTLANTSPYAGMQSKVIWDINGVLSTGSVREADLLLDLEDQHTELAEARKAILSNGPRIRTFNQISQQYPTRTQASIIASAFRSGLSSSVFLENFSGNLDTHSNHPKTHLTELLKSFEDVKTLLDTLKSSPGVDAQGNVVSTNNLLDQTTVMLVSEFTRTPALNGSQGKDHNPQANSAILFTPGLKNEAFGASTLVTRAQSRSGTPYLAGMPLDITTQKPVLRREDTFILRPDTIAATVAKSMGMDPATISRGLGSAPLLTSALA